MLMLAGIREILLINTPRDRPLFKGLLDDASQRGISDEYAEQPRPEGLAQALIIGESFLCGGGASLVLDDNIFYSQGLSDRLRNAARREEGTTVFGYYVRDPESRSLPFDFAQEPRNRREHERSQLKLLPGPGTTKSNV